MLVFFYQKCLLAVVGKVFYITVNYARLLSLPNSQVFLSLVQKRSHSNLCTQIATNDLYTDISSKKLS